MSILEGIYLKSIMKLGRMVSLAAACMMVFSAGTLSADQDDDDHGQFHFRSNQYPDFQNKQYPNVYKDLLQPVVTAIDYHTRVIYLFNYENDGLIIVDPLSITGWPGDVPLQHTGVLPGGNVVYITTDNTELHSSYIVEGRQGISPSGPFEKRGLGAWRLLANLNLYLRTC